MPGRHPLEKKIRRFRRRLFAIQTARRILQCLLGATLIVLGLLLLERLFAVEVPFRLAAESLGAAAVAVGLLWSLFRRPALIDTAVAVDEKLKLRERVSSALCMLQSDKGMERAVVEDAQTHAGKLRVGDVFPYPFFREIQWIAASCAIAAAIYFFVPPMQLLARAASDKSAASQPVSVQEAKKASAELQQLKDQLANRTDIKDPLQLGQLEKNLEELQKQLEAKKLEKDEALAKLSKLSDQIQTRKQEMEEKLKDFQQLQPLESDRFTKDLAKDLEAGKFDEAMKKMQDLAQQAQNGKMSEQDKKDLAAEMQKMAEQMQNNPQMANALKQAAQQLNQGDLQKMAEQMKMASSEMKDMAEAMQQMQMLDQMQDKMDQGKQEMAGAMPGEGEGGDKSMDGQLHTTDKHNGSPWKEGDISHKGSGLGGPGRGMGGVADMAPDSVKFAPNQIKGQLQQGKILSMVKVQGDQVKGQSTVQYQASQMDYEQAAEDTLNREPMPKEYKNLVKDYFDAIKPDVQNKKPASSSTK